MTIQWAVLAIIICFLAFSYYKQYPFKTRLISLVTLFIVSLILALPILGFSVLTLLGLFLIEKIWIILAVMLFIEIVISKKGRILKLVLIVVSLIIYFYLRTMI